MKKLWLILAAFLPLLGACVYDFEAELTGDEYTVVVEGDILAGIEIISLAVYIFGSVSAENGYNIIIIIKGDGEFLFVIFVFVIFVRGIFLPHRNESHILFNGNGEIPHSVLIEPAKEGVAVLYGVFGFRCRLAGDNVFTFYLSRAIGIIIDQNSLTILSVFNDAGAADAGIKRGDKLHGVGDKTVNDTDNVTLTNLLAGEEGSTVDVTVERGGELITFTVTRKRLTETSVTYNMEDDNIGYIMINQFVSATPSEFATAVDALIEDGAVGLVIDLRNNPGGIVNSAIDVVDYIIPDEENRLIASYTYAGGEYVFYTDDGHSVDVPIAVLCNGGSASSSELFLGAIRDFDAAGIIDAVIIGEKTYGKGVVQTTYSLSDGSGITFTIGYFNPPSGVNCNGIGIDPDIILPEDYVNNIHVSTATEEIYKILNDAAELGNAA